MPPTELPLPPATTAPTGSTSRVVAVFAAKIVVGLALGAAILWLGPMQGFLSGLKLAVPPALQPHVDTFLVPYWAAFFAAVLVGLAITSALALDGQSPSTRTAAACTCLVLGIVAGLLVYWLVGYALPFVSRRMLFGPEGMHRYAIDFPPYLLTNAELSHVQSYLRRQGGYSPRVALMWQLRAWCALMVPVMGALAATAVARMRRGRALVWLGAIELAVLTFWLVGSMIAVGPAAYARPTAIPQEIAWGLLLALAIGASIALRRAVAALDEAEVEHAVSVTELR